MDSAQVSEPTVQTTRNGAVLIVRLNRPASSNAVNAALALAVSAAMDELDADDELRVGVLTGAGKGFCAGMDLKAFLAGDSPSTARGFGGVTRTPPKKPLIAAVEGFAVAGGLELALACDLIIAARDAKFGIPEPKHGLVAAAGGLIRLPRRIPYHVAMYLALTGEMIDGERAYAIGLVNELTEKGKALDRALALAQLIASNAPLAVQWSRAIVRESMDLDEPAGWELQDRLGFPALETQDAAEGARAFAEKRAPVWTSR
jgi:enoyl-CoA hydratase